MSFLKILENLYVDTDISSLLICNLHSIDITWMGLITQFTIP